MIYQVGEAERIGVKLPADRAVIRNCNLHTCGGGPIPGEALKRVRFCTYCGGLIVDPRRANNPRTVYGSDEHRRAAKREDRAVTAGKFCRLCKRPKSKTPKAKT